MNRDEHRAIRESLGVYVLGQLSPGEAAAVGAHLDGCAECRAEVADISPVLGPLRQVEPAHLDDTPVPPPWLGDRILAEARAEGRPSRPRKRGPALAAAAALAAGLIGGGIGFAAGRGPEVPREPVTLSVRDDRVDAQATVIPHTWGVEITLAAGGFARDAVYRVVVVDDSGRRVDAGQFIGTGDDRMVCNLNSSVLRAGAAGFDVLATDGSVVVHGDL